MKIKKHYVCSNCGAISNKWSGQCFDCNSWSTIEEEIISSNKQSHTNLVVPQEIELLDGNVSEEIRIHTTITELNRVLGGGLVAGSAILIGGDPGIGKSTLLLQLAANLSANGIGCLYITGEESLDQIKLRAKRLELNIESKTGILAATNIEEIIATLNANKKNIRIVVIDSIQTMYSSLFASSPGTVSQVRAAAHELTTYCKQHNIALLLACHVTKDGQLAGPKILEHMVDTVLYFEGDHHHHFRILRSIKNRFGSVGEIGVFEMTGIGLVEVSNPSALFLIERENNISGTVVFSGMEGSRPMLIEIQALIAPSNMVTPRRSVVGWDLNRLSMIIAVLNVRYGLNLSTCEVYLSVTGGLKISEPAADLAVAAALISAATNKPVPNNSIFFGEIGLSGEIRKVTQGEARLNEASRLGFNKIICSKLQNLDSSKVISIAHLKQIKSLW